MSLFFFTFHNISDSKNKKYAFVLLVYYTVTPGKPRALTLLDAGFCLTTETSSNLFITSQVVIYEKRPFTDTCRDAGHTAKSFTFSVNTKRIIKLLYILKSRCAASQ